jgi:hypothetical protein
MCENTKLNEVLNAFIENYQPAGSTAEADEEFSSSEIKRVILDLIEPGSISNDHIYDFLIENNYRFEMVGGEFKWLFKNA